MMNYQHCGLRGTHGHEGERDAIGEGPIRSGEVLSPDETGYAQVHR